MKDPSCCRSGNRSKTAARIPAEPGHTSTIQFGGIPDWSYEKAK